jgi:hypothetical protein
MFIAVRSNPDIDSISMKLEIYPVFPVGRTNLPCRAEGLATYDFRDRPTSLFE